MFGQFLVNIPQQSVYLGGVVMNDLRTPTFVCFLFVRCSDLFKGMAEWPVTDVVQESGKKCDSCVGPVVVTPFPCDHVSKTARSVIDADAVGEAAVRGAWKYQVGES